MTTFESILHTIPAALAIGAIYSAGELTRSRRRRDGGDAPGFMNDVRAAEDGFVELFAKSRVASAILAALARHRESIGFDALVKGVRDYDTGIDLSGATALSAYRVVLGVLLSARLVRMHAGGFWITALGRGVHRRIRERGEDTSSAQHGPSQPHRTHAVHPTAADRGIDSKHRSLASVSSRRR